MPRLNVSFEVEKKVIEEFDKIYKEQGFEKRSPFLRKMVIKIVNYDRHKKGEDPLQIS